jgi:7-cyano-7-deazaguanine synthase
MQWASCSWNAHCHVGTLLRMHGRFRFYLRRRNCELSFSSVRYLTTHRAGGCQRAARVSQRNSVTIDRMHRRAVILLSGGIDSFTSAAMAKSQGYEIAALSFLYQQRHRVEIEAARRVAAVLGVTQHLVLELPLGRIGGSALTADIEVPKDESLEEIGNSIPITYVPARNTIFLSFALAWAEVMDAESIFIGVNALDYSGYPDCRPEYIEAFAAMANLGTKKTVQGEMRIRIHTPLIHMTKAEIIQAGVALGLDYGITHSCYDPDLLGRACGRCESCLLRKKGFDEAGVPDPTIYTSCRKS